MSCSKCKRQLHIKNCSGCGRSCSCYDKQGSLTIILVTGDRKFNDYEEYKLVDRAIKNRKPDCVVQGGASGADEMARQVCEKRGIPCFTCHAWWNFFKRAAGPIRNGWMLKFLHHIDEVLAFHNNIKESKGTKNMIDQAKKKKIKVTLFRTGKKEKVL
jgi:hypothetical protein